MSSLCLLFAVKLSAERIGPLEIGGLVDLRPPIGLSLIHI